MSDQRPNVPVVALTDLEQQLLAFERRRWTYQGAKEQAVTDELGMTPTRYAQLLNALIDQPEAYLHDPMLVKRLRRLRDTRRRARAS